MLDEPAPDFTDPWTHALRVTRPAVLLMPGAFRSEIEAEAAAAGIAAAVVTHNTAALFTWLNGLFVYQGVSDVIAAGYARRHGLPDWADLASRLEHRRPACPHLVTVEALAGCGYRKTARTCAEPRRLARCPLPRLPLRKGSLNQAAFGLYLFIRDHCPGGDFVAWLDAQLAAADIGASANPSLRAAMLREGLLAPLVVVPGVSRKVWSLALATLLLGTAQTRPTRVLRERWTAAGSGLIVVDTLVHNHLTRTGILSRLGREHAYGPRCQTEEGCLGVLAGLAARIDARAFASDLPAYCPRFVQHALWRFCSEAGWGICSGRRIARTVRCEQQQCPSYRDCDRLALVAAIAEDPLGQDTCE